MAREHRLHVRLNDEEWSIIEAAIPEDVPSVNWVRKTLVTAASKDQTLAHYHEQIAALDIENQRLEGLVGDLQQEIKSKEAWNEKTSKTLLESQETLIDVQNKLSESEAHLRGSQEINEELLQDKEWFKARDQTLVDEIVKCREDLKVEQSWYRYLVARTAEIMTLWGWLKWRFTKNRWRVTLDPEAREKHE